MVKTCFIAFSQEYGTKVWTYGAWVDSYLFVILLSSVIFLCYIGNYIWFILRASHRVEYIEENRERMHRVKFVFGFILTFVLDIPGTCVACVLYTMQQGAKGKSLILILIQRLISIKKTFFIQTPILIGRF